MADGARRSRVFAAGVLMAGIWTVLVLGMFEWLATEDETEHQEMRAMLPQEDLAIKDDIHDDEVFVMRAAYGSFWAVGTLIIAGATVLIGRKLRHLETSRQEIAEAHRFYKQLVDAIATPIFFKDGTQRYMGCNTAFARDVAGRPAEEVVGRTLSTLGLSLTKEQVEAYEGHAQQTLSLGRSLQFDGRLTSRDGAVHDYIFHESPLRDAAGRVTGLVGTMLDVTDRNRSGHELHQAKVAAEDALAELSRVNRQLEDALSRASQMAEAAEAANLAKTEFLANMSHEIRTPLTAILGYTELLMDNSQDVGERTERLAIIQRNGRHLLGLINDILDLSKIEAGKLMLESQACSIPGTVADVVSLMRVRAAEKGIEVRVEYPTPLPEQVLLDDNRLRQVLVNLVGNAVKFTLQGHVTITTHLVSGWKERGDAVQLEIRDTGVGIPADKIAMIGQPFFQVDASTSRRFGGTGLGLAIVRKLIERMGGELSVQSVLGVGSCFTLTLPIVPVPGTRMLANPAEALACRTQAHASQVGVQRLDGLRVLLAEDGPDNQRLICTVLQRAGGEVDIADNGRSACELALAQPYDVILMDMQMPELDGYEATSLLRSRGYRGAIIALTAHAMPADRERCMEAGCSDYLTKPIERVRLLETVARHAHDGRDCSAAAAATQADVHANGSQVGTAPSAAIQSELAGESDLLDVIDDFVRQLPQRQDEMRQALSAGAFEELTRLAHRMKGAGGSYGYPALTAAGKELETLARSHDHEGSTLALTRLGELIDAVTRGWTYSRQKETA